MSQEQRTAFDKLKTDYLAVKEECDAEESAAEVEQFLTDEADRESRTRRGPGGRIDPEKDDSLPGGRETYGDRFGTDRDAMRQHGRTEQRRALAMQVWANDRVKNGFTPTDEHRQAIKDLKSSLGDGWEIGCFDTLELRECRAAQHGFKGDEAVERVNRAMQRVSTKRESRAVAGAATQGNLAPQVTTEAFEKAGLMIGGLYNAAEVRVTPTGAKMVWPTANDTANEGKQIDEVNAEGLDGVDPDVASFFLASYEFWSHFIRLGNVTLRDSPVALASEIGIMIGERIARAVNRKATSGDGVGTMTGIETSAVLGRLMATATTYAWEDLYHLKFSVDGTYRNQGSFMMNDEILVEMMTLTDNQGRPILIEPNDGGLPRLLNAPVHTNNHMAAAADVSNNRPAVTFGDHSKFKLRLVGNVRTGRYVERFAEYDQTGFDGKRGADGGLLDAGTHPVKALKPAA